MTFAALAFTGCSKDNDNGLDDNDSYLYEMKVWEREYKFGEFASGRKNVKVYRYNQSGGLIYEESLVQSPALDFDYSNEVYYTYDEAGLLTEEKRYSMTLLDRVFKYSYNNGLMSEKKEYNDDGGLSTIWTYTYENGRLVKEVEDNIIINVDYYALIEYNNRGLVSQKKQYNSDGTLFYTYLFDYDAKGNLLIETNVSPEGNEQVVQNYTYEYNNDGTVRKKTNAHLYGWWIDIYEYTYDDEKNISTVTNSRDDDGVIQPQSLHEYEYIYK